LLGVGAAALRLARGSGEEEEEDGEEFVAAVTFGHRGGGGQFKGDGLLLLDWAGLW